MKKAKSKMSRKKLVPIELKPDITGWEPINLTPSKINQEPAYIYKR